MCVFRKKVPLGLTMTVMKKMMLRQKKTGNYWKHLLKTKIKIMVGCIIGLCFKEVVNLKNKMIFLIYYKVFQFFQDATMTAIS